ncbi:MAG: hypothetical protein ACIWVG_29820, partial [Gloeotrichia echinulata HAB0833]
YIQHSDNYYQMAWGDFGKVLNIFQKCDAEGYACVGVVSRRNRYYSLDSSNFPPKPVVLPLLGRYNLPVLEAFLITTAIYYS